MKLRNSPLVMVLAQVRFAPVLKMADYVPAIQEKLRRNGYPRFGSQKIREIALGPQPEVRQAQRWLFANKENNESVVLSNDFIVLETSRYTVFEDFAKHLETVLGVIGEETDLSLVHRLGLRFVDLILPEDDESLDEYIKPQLHGLQADDLAVDELLNQFESRGQTREGQLVVRLHQNNKGAFLPPDLGSTHLAFASSPQKDVLATLLDIDHFSEQDRDYDVPALINAMWELHVYTGKAFNSSVTDKALECWGKE
ncbi:MAG: TIGR04255 family protein [Thermoanaerobaculales bacterium]|nr:TIGR04255 family protein [Thermoanaerobaculales bacterium]